jgi:fructose-specific phosphotransferase system IIA component
MILTQILQPDCVKVPVQANDKEGVITELVDLLSEHRLLRNRDVVLQAVLARERTRSTGIGAGVAVPHGKCDGVEELIMALGIAAEPIDFGSIDGHPVKIIVLLVSPSDRTGPHIQALAQISRLMLDGQLKLKLEQVTSAAEVYQLIMEKESQ